MTRQESDRILNLIESLCASVKMTSEAVTRLAGLEPATSPLTETDDEPEDVSEPEEVSDDEQRWRDLLVGHPELIGSEQKERVFTNGVVRPAHYSYAYGSDYADAHVISGLMKAMATRPEGASTHDVLAGMFGTLTEAWATYDNDHHINNELAYISQKVGGRLHWLSLSTKAGPLPATVKTRPRVGNAPALYTVASYDDGENHPCHTVVGGKYLCGLKPQNSGKSVKANHSLDACKKAGHKVCGVCAALGGR